MRFSPRVRRITLNIVTVYISAFLANLAAYGIAEAMSMSGPNGWLRQVLGNSILSIVFLLFGLPVVAVAAMLLDWLAGESSRPRLLALVLALVPAAASLLLVLAVPQAWPVFVWALTVGVTSGSLVRLPPAATAVDSP